MYVIQQMQKKSKTAQQMISYAGQHSFSVGRLAKDAGNRHGTDHRTENDKEASLSLRCGRSWHELLPPLSTDAEVLDRVDQVIGDHSDDSVSEHAALTTAGADSTLLTIAGANHEDAAFHSLAVLGAVAGFFIDKLRHGGVTR